MKLANKKAIEIQDALLKLLQRGDLTARTSFDIALLSNAIDKQITAYVKTRDTLIKKYTLSASPGEIAGTIKLTCGVEGGNEEETEKIRENQLAEFANQFTELMEAEDGDIPEIKIHFPSGIDIKPIILKPLTDFLVVE